MKTKISIFFLTVLFSCSLSAQTISIVKQYALFQDIKSQKVFYPQLNLQGDKLLFSNEAYQGLSLYDFNTKSVTDITESAGAGYEPIFDNNSSKIFYRNTSFENGRRMDAMESYDLINSKKELMLSPQRDLRQARNFQNGFVVTANRKLMKSTFGKTKEVPGTYVTTQDLKIFLYINAKFVILNPLNEVESRYLWVNLSPNGKMILFTAAGKGAFICDLEGNIISKLGYLNAPVWFDDDYVVGMQDKDDGQFITSSKVVMMSTNGKVNAQISSKTDIAMYPTASKIGSKIAYSTLNGEIKITEIAIK